MYTLPSQREFGPPVQAQAEEPLGTDSHQTISKWSNECWLLIGHKKCFVLLCPIGEQHLLSSFREFVHDSYWLDHGYLWWESVPRGFFTWAWNLFSHLFSLPDWLPLGLQGWGKAVCPYLWLVTGQVIYSYPYKEMAYLKVSDILPLLPQLK